MTSAADLPIGKLLALGPVVPVLEVHDVALAVRTAMAIVAGGLRVIEVTLRTPQALDSIAAIARDVPDALVGAGSLIAPEHFDAAQRAGAVFAVSPGSTPALARAWQQSRMPWLPGVATVSEVMLGLEHGLDHFKLFPAASIGTNLPRAMLGPLPAVRFCPTGGIGAATAHEWLELPNVVCVGGTWIAPRKLVDAGDWTGIEALSRAAAELRRVLIRPLRIAGRAPCEVPNINGPRSGPVVAHARLGAMTSAMPAD